MNGGQQIVGGLLAYCFSLLKRGPLKSWQALFITYGGVTVLWGIFVLFWMPDSPMQARFLTQEERVAAIERIRNDQGGVANKELKREQVWEALTDIRTWLIVLTTLLSKSTIYLIY